MGGFRLFKRVSEEQSDSQSISQENEDPLHPLLAGDLVRDDIYTFIMSTEAEIKDKGKSDCLAKSLVLVQTSWFMIQCIARAIERLPVTHLKIVTLAYAAMNFMMSSSGTNLSMSINLFKCSENRMSKNRSQRRGDCLWRKASIAWEQYLN